MPQNPKKIKTTLPIGISYLVGAGRIIQDARSKRYSHIDLFDLVIIPQGNDSWFQTFYIGGKLNVYQDGKYTIEIKIEDPDKKIIGTASFPETSLVVGQAPLSAFFSLVKFSTQGKHIIRVSINGEIIQDDKYYFDVIKIGGKSG